MGFISTFLLIRLIVSLVNLLFSTRLPGNRELSGEPKVSVLIPARNEAGNIHHLLDDLTKSSFKNIEVLVYDDYSQDETAKMVREFKNRDERIQLLEGKELPEGWLGKNHACHQLSIHARGKYLLFLDADVRITPGLITDSLSYLMEHRLNLLSIFPKQIMKSTGEKITVPLMNWILTSFLPIPLIKGSSYASLAAANGQFMLFDAGFYRKHHWHQKMRKEAVEDIRIMQAIKEIPDRGHTLLSNGQISCRMYRNFREAVNGFSKNTHAFFGNSRMLLSFFTLISSFGFIAFLLAGPYFLIFYFLMVILIRVFTSLASRQNPVLNTVTAPLQQFSLIWINSHAFLNKTRGYGVWKGRNIRVE